MAKFHCLPVRVLMVAALLVATPFAAFAQNRDVTPRAVPLAVPRVPAEMTQATAIVLQENLRYLGYDPGPIDGVIGPATRRQLQRFYEDAGVVVPSSRVLASLWVKRAADAARARGGSRAVALRYLAVAADSAGSDLERRVDQDRPDGGTRGLTALMAAPARPATVAPAPAPAPAATLAPATPGTATQTMTAGVMRSTSNLGAPVATRDFAGPDQYPPEGYRGYGVVAFKSLSTAFDRERHNIICEAYSAALIPDSQQKTRTADKFVTIWPVESAAIAQTLNAAPMSARGELCDRAIRSYNIQLADNAIRAARAAGFDDTGRGPFFLGWVPAHTYGAQDALVIVMDLSTVESYPQAEALIGEWKLDIQSDPALLSQPMNPEMLRRKLRRWSDKYGYAFLSLVRGE